MTITEYRAVVANRLAVEGFSYFTAPRQLLERVQYEVFCDHMRSLWQGYFDRQQSA